MSDPGKAVFLSYASQDAEAAKRICDALRLAGVEVWFDQSELVGGDQWDAKIRRQINTCALFVPLVSANTQARLEGYFRVEWKLAAQRTYAMADEKAFLLPVLLDATRDSDAKVPAEFRAVQWTKLPLRQAQDLRPAEDTLVAFCTRVKKLLSEEQGTGSEESGSAVGASLDDARGRRQAAPLQISSRPWLVPVIVAVIAAGGLALWRPWSKSAPASAKDAVPRPVIAEKAIIPADEKSVAVLAFANLSDDKGNDSFGDSVSEELLNVLAKVPGLKVTARTSAFHFKGKDTAIPEIARQLGVAYVVEGSVRRSGDKVRITAQLIKAEGGFHVWSDTFTRDLKDIFAVQDEIARLIAENLQLKLGMKVNRTAINPEAYQLYLEAARAWNLRNKASVDRAEQLLQQALALQPDFPRALALMANVYTVRATENAVRMSNQGKGMGIQALAWAERALALDPELGEGHAAKGNALDVLGRWPEARAEYRRATELAPNYATGHQWYARSLSQDGYLDESIAELRRAAELDPLAPRILDNLSAAYSWAGRQPEALEAVDRALVIQPGSLQALSFRAEYLILLERYQEVLPILEKLITDLNVSPWVRVDLARTYLALGREAEAQALLTRAETGGPLFQGVLLCVLGRPGEAIPLLQPTFSMERDVILWSYQAYMPRESPEFQRKLAEWGLAEAWQRAEAWRAKHLPKKAARKTEVSALIDQKSVAVLAFANLSDDKSNEYFSDGISEELLNVLAKVPGLKVSARTSAFYFKGKEVPIPEIARQLGVAYVVEGSVRKAGDKVRITAQLIKADGGFHVWSDTFTRDLKDIFAVQDEIAGLIAKNLEVKMGIAAARPTVDLEAYQEYLTGRALVSKAANADLREAVGRFERAVAIEPKFTAAWVSLASAHTQLGRWGGAPTLQSWAAARAAIDRALALEPDSPDVLLALGWIRRTAEWDWRGAEQAFRRSLQLRPNHPDALAGAAVLLFNVGQTEEAFRLGQQAAQLDPLNAATQIDLSIMFYLNHNWREAEQSARRALQLAPGGGSYRSILGWSLTAQGRYDEAEAEIARDNNESEQAQAFGSLALARGQDPVARKWLARLEEIALTHGDSSDVQMNIAWLSVGLGDTDRAFAALERARASRDPSLSWLRNSWYLESLRTDPRWPAFLRKIGLADDQLK